MKTSAICLVVLVTALLAGCGGPTGETVTSALTVDAGAAQSVDEGTTVSLAGTASAGSGASVTGYNWTQTSGTSVTLSNPTSNQASFVAPVLTSSITLTFRLTVTDSNGKSASDTVSVTVNPVNAVPVANAGDDLAVNARVAVVIAGSGTDADGEVTAFAWAQTAGPDVTTTGADSAQLSFTAPIVSEATALTFSLTVTDNEGGTGSDDVTVTVNPAANQSPTANAGPDQSVEGNTTVTLSGSGSDSDGTIAAYAWTQTGGAAVTLTGADTSGPSFTAPVLTSTQPFTFQLTVTDNEGATATDEVTVTVHPIGADGSNWDSMVWDEGAWG